MTTMTLSPATIAVLNRPRWAMQGWYGGRKYSWSQCMFCGHSGERNCEPVACMLCGTVQCKNRADCWVCSFGWLPGWSRGYLMEHKQCSYAKCSEPAVAIVPGKKRACMMHARKKLGARLAESIAVRDGGKGWQRWRWLDPSQS